MNITEQFKSFALLGAEWVMWVLIALSVVSVTIMVERAIYFFGKHPDVSEIIDKVREFLRKKDIAGAKEFLASKQGIAPAIAHAALKEAPNGLQAVEEAASSARIREKLKLEKNLAYLGTVGNNAPFVGLLGTVIGIIQAFDDLSLNATGGASTVMAGISEALVATAIGLLVAIPAVVAFNIFQRRIKTRLGDADAVVHTILSGLNPTSPASKKG
ncbi:MAG: MotA/TolQ/ExbB proton channel family protein [Deltaproteobacteria bacterium]|nr:MotA/TolQ/ExbB proton channel family protein [Deltaproteobacteria bacterium]MBN2671518.1 MotA/TolQ/ExbB proton channel family protein [Deltaproteobacteria bacterium]